MAAKYTTDKQINSLKIYPTGYYIHCRINGKRREKKIAPRNVLINIARKEAQKIILEDPGFELSKNKIIVSHIKKNKGLSLNWSRIS